MKIRLLLLTGLICVGSVSPSGAAEAKKGSKAAPGKYPSIIQMPPTGEPAPVKGGLIQSEMGGREMQFFQDVNRAGREQLALAELGKTKSGSEQIKAIADTLAATQV